MTNTLPALATAEAPSSAPKARAAATTLARVDSDEHLLALWLHGRSSGTQRAYAADLAAFRVHVACKLSQVTLGDVQDFTDSLAPLATATKPGGSAP